MSEAEESPGISEADKPEQEVQEMKPNTGSTSGVATQVFDWLSSLWLGLLACFTCCSKNEEEEEIKNDLAERTADDIDGCNIQKDLAKQKVDVDSDGRKVDGCNHSSVWECMGLAHWKWKDESGNLLASSEGVSGDISAKLADPAPSGIIRWEVHKDSISERFLFSDAVEVGGLKWTTVVYRKDDCIGVHLCLMIGDNTLWSVDVAAEFKLVNHKNDKDSITMKSANTYKQFFHTFTMSESQPSYGFSQFARWSDVMDEEKGFIMDNKFTLDVQFALSKLRGMHVSCDCEKDLQIMVDSSKGASSYSIRMEIDITEDDSTYDVIEMGGILWRIDCYADYQDSVGFRLELRDGDYELKSVDVELECKLINHDERKSITKKLSKRIDWKHKIGWMYNPKDSMEFDWDNFDEEEGFIKESRIAMQVDISLSNINGFRSSGHVDFLDPNEPSHDVTIITSKEHDGPTVYANKAILSIHSPRFYKLFTDDESLKVFKLKGDDFLWLDLLHAIYPPYIYGSTAVDVTHFVSVLVPSWDIPVSKSPSTDEVQCSLLDLVVLQKHCLDQLKTVNEVEKLKGLRKSYDKLPQNVKDALELKMKDNEGSLLSVILSIT